MIRTQAVSELNEHLLAEVPAQPRFASVARRLLHALLCLGFTVLAGLAAAMPAAASSVSPQPFGGAVNGYAIMTRNDASTLVSLDFNAPDPVIPVGPSPNGATIWGTAFLNGTLYALGDTGFYTIDTVSGALTRISDAPPPANEIWGMTVDPTTQTLYWIGGTGGVTLSTIDPATGASTLVGSISGIPAPINITAIAIDAEGQLYGIEQQNDNLIRVDKATGAATVVGPLDVPTLFKASLAFDPVGGTLYFFNREFAANGVHTVDKNTGHATFVGRARLEQDFVDLVGLAIPLTCRTGDTIFCNGFEAGL